MDLSEQRLFNIENNGCMNLSHLLSLDLSKNKLAELMAEWFLPLKELAYLFISDNDLLRIEPLSFNVLLKIESMRTSIPALCCLNKQSLLCMVDSSVIFPVCHRFIPSTYVRGLCILLSVTIIWLR